MTGLKIQTTQKEGYSEEPKLYSLVCTVEVQNSDRSYTKVPEAGYLRIFSSSDRSMALLARERLTRLSFADIEKIVKTKDES